MRVVNDRDGQDRHDGVEIAGLEGLYTGVDEFRAYEAGESAGAGQIAS